MGVIKIKEFNICNIHSTDFDKSLKFYTEILGFKKIQDKGKGALLRANDSLMIFLEGGRKQRESHGSQFPGISLSFSTKEGIRTTYENLKDAGVKFTGEYMEKSPECNVFRCEDPSGNVIEFSGKP
jgi:predicted enzyme related to lactoylglutathione lyase